MGERVCLGSNQATQTESAARNRMATNVKRAGAGGDPSWCGIVVLQSWERLGFLIPTLLRPKLSLNA